MPLTVFLLDLLLSPHPLVSLALTVTLFLTLSSSLAPSLVSLPLPSPLSLSLSPSCCFRVARAGNFELALQYFPGLVLLYDAQLQRAAAAAASLDVLSGQVSLRRGLHCRTCRHN